MPETICDHRPALDDRLFGVSSADLALTGPAVILFECHYKVLHFISLVGDTIIPRDAGCCTRRVPTALRPEQSHHLRERSSAGLEPRPRSLLPLRAR